MTPADAALLVFTTCNTARVFAYLPQIVKIGRDRQGAAAISYTTWMLFGVSHLSTVAYAILVVDDWRMAAIFAANTLCCGVIVGVTAWKALAGMWKRRVGKPWRSQQMWPTTSRSRPQHTPSNRSLAR